MLCIIVLCTVFFFLGIHTERKMASDRVEYVSETDTIRSVDTVFYPKPVPIKTYELRVDTVFLSDTIREKDYVLLPITSKVFSDAGYKLQISGYNPTLDWVEVYAKKEHVINTVTRVETVYKTKRWGLGVQLGIGTYDFKSLHPYIGIGISYNILTW